ncbi:DUF6338 family protein [soil metagenome]
MALPDSTFALVALVVVFVPGFVFAVVRIWFRGFRADDKGIDTRIAQALVVSVIFDAAYLMIVRPNFGDVVKVTDKSITVLDPVALGLTILVGAVAVPGLLAVVLYQPWRLRRRVPKPPKEKRDPRFPLQWSRRWNYSSVPTAWDEAATDPSNRFVRVLLPDKRYVGGFYGAGSYVSTYPEPRDLFISDPFVMDQEGNFGEQIKGSLGLWLTIPDGAIVDWVDPNFTPDTEEAGEQHG